MWFITVFEKCEPARSDWEWPFGDTHTWGYYSKRETAVLALHENWTDMWETCYHYAVIEKYDEGINHYVTGSRQFFEYDPERGGYFEIEVPEFVHPLEHFAY